MKKETLEKAKEIEEDIRSIDNAMDISRNTRHFEFVEHYAYDSRKVKMPRWMNEKLLPILADERERLVHELEVLSDDMQQETGDWQPAHKYVNGDRVAYDGIEYECRNGKFVPLYKRSWLERWYNMIPFIFILLDVAVLSCVAIKYWATIRPYFDIITIFNTFALIIFTMLTMIGIETYIDNKKKR